MRSHKSLFWFAVPLGLVFLACTGTAFAQYKQKNLVSDKPGVARYTDRNLINGWGLIDLPGSGFVVADAGTGVVTFYGSDGRTLRLPGWPFERSNKWMLISSTLAYAEASYDFVSGGSSPDRTTLRLAGPLC